MLAVVQQNIAAGWPASLSASDASQPLAAAACPVRRLPHVLLVVHARPREFLSVLVIAERLPGFLAPHHGPCFCGAFSHPEW